MLAEQFGRRGALAGVLPLFTSRLRAGASLGWPVFYLWRVSIWEPVCYTTIRKQAASNNRGRLGSCRSEPGTSGAQPAFSTSGTHKRERGGAVGVHSEERFSRPAHRRQTAGAPCSRRALFAASVANFKAVSTLSLDDGLAEVRAQFDLGERDSLRHPSLRRSGVARFRQSVHSRSEVGPAAELNPTSLAMRTAR